ncbi:MAG: hypothetical protein K940chlam9_00456 [Chlamydiae bacterium]|nr:hypothetical protein [Chlamydiota bacterium]
MKKEAKILSQEQQQVDWAIALFLFYLSLVEKRGIVEASYLESLKTPLQADGEAPPEAKKELLNEQICALNAHEKTLLDATKYSPFPPFSFAVGEHKLSGILEQLDMVERTLTETAEVGIIEWKEEGEVFSSFLLLFRKLEKGEILPEEAMARLASELEKVNLRLSKPYTFPLPDISAYES